ncbi:hypothetical protein [Mycolicibacterium sediminis]|nr:hypothetical protein [Mycolicibacterium sediminis]
MFIHDLIADAGGAATTAQLLTLMSRKTIDTHVRTGLIRRVCRGVYSLTEPDVEVRLTALTLATGHALVPCLGTAANIWGFDTERDRRLHVLDPGIRMRPSIEVMVHQRAGAPLRRVNTRLVTAPAWTAVEVARTLRRPRALATLDAALRVGVSRDELTAALEEQGGRRGIVAVRELLQYADGRAESPMESEARLVFIDHGLPLPELQYEIVDHCGDLWRVDFAWEDAKLVAEYDSMEWHANPLAWKRDRLKVERLKERGWTTVPIVVDDVRVHPWELASCTES